MKISELESKLKELREKHGDIEVCAWGIDDYGYAENLKTLTVDYTGNEPIGPRNVIFIQTVNDD